MNEHIRHQSFTTVPVLGTTMAYREAGGRTRRSPCFLHGNPDLVLHLAQHHPAGRAGRDIASRPTSSASANPASPISPIGSSTMSAISMPSSHGIGISSAYLVAQDWGTALAFHLAARRPDFVRGLAFMEFIRLMPNWEDFTSACRGARNVPQIQDGGRRRSDDPRGNAFVERVLPGSILRKLGDDEARLSGAFPTPEEPSAHARASARLADRRRAAGCP